MDHQTHIDILAGRFLDARAIVVLRRRELADVTIRQTARVDEARASGSMSRIRPVVEMADALVAVASRALDEASDRCTNAWIALRDAMKPGDTASLGGGIGITCGSHAPHTSEVP